MSATPAPDQDGSDTPGDTSGPVTPGTPAGAAYPGPAADGSGPAADSPGPAGQGYGGTTVGGAEMFGATGHPGDGTVAPTSERIPRTGAERGWVKALVGLATAVAVGLLGFPLGWLWHTLAPSLPVLIGDQRQLFLADVEGEQRAGAEGMFILMSLAAGLVLAIVVWIALRRFRGPVTAVALGIGGVAAGWLAWRFGHTIGLGAFHRQARTAPSGTVIHLPPDLRIKQPGDVARWSGIPYISGDLLYLGITSLVVYLLLAGFSLSPSLNVRRKRRDAPADPLPPATTDDRAPGGVY